ncbi:MAG: signal peptidase [Planctomycetota bacterium]|nr:MAG: signal peptidase [Planctomycetota bacterium]
MPKYVVRHGSMRTLGIFAPRGNEAFVRGTRVIARTTRGLETGEVLCEATPEAIEQLQDPDNGQILRSMSADDEKEFFRIAGRRQADYDLCDAQIRQSGLPMKLIDVERIFGGERIIVFYLAENRVDFRDLVKSLAGEFQTRIEMRQIGVRDEAKLLADYGDCGKPVCCNTHLSEMPPVSMKMAKLQKATLDPNKISGRCGRLKCCLRYEYDTYEEYQQQLPPIGADVVTSKGRARVLAHEILARQVLVSMEDNRRILIDAAEVLTVLPRAGRGGRSEGEGTQSEREPRSQGRPRGRERDSRRESGGEANAGQTGNEPDQNDPEIGGESGDDPLDAGDAARGPREA